MSGMKDLAIAEMNGERLDEAQAVRSAEIVIVPELENAAIEAAQSGLSVDGVESLKRGFAPHFAKMHEMAAQANLITEAQPKQARVIRLQIKAIRTEAEKTRKELKADSLLRGKAIDGINNVLLYQLKPVEDRLEAIEKAEEIAAAKKKEELRMSRVEAVSPYLVDVHLYPLAEMSQAAFDQLLTNSKAAHEAAEKAKQEAEVARLAAVEAARVAEEKRRADEQAERERLQLREKELLAEAEKARKEKAAADAKAKKERDAAEAKLKAEQAAAQKKLDEERAKAEAERQRVEMENAKAQAAAAKLAQEERSKREKVEQELAAAKKKQADDAAAAAKGESDRKALAEKERKRLAKAGDKEKLKAYLNAFSKIEFPDLSNSGRDFLQELSEKYMEELQSHIDSL